VEDADDDAMLHQIALHPVAWPEVKTFIERRWPNFKIIPGFTTDEEREAGIVNHMMAMK
jgi:hypothetical protein